MAYFCPKCDAKTYTMETRGEIRRRKCKTCGYMFYTQEEEYELPVNGKNPFTVKRYEYAKGGGHG